jgi:hypothetical protein
MQPTVRLTRQAQALLPSDDDNGDHGSKMKSPTSALRPGAESLLLAAILFVCAASLIYLNSSFSLSHKIKTTKVKAM